MSFRRLFVIVLCLTLGWASSVTSVAAQSVRTGKRDKLVRVTYPVADLVIPIGNYSGFGDRRTTDEKTPKTTDAMAESLMKVIRETIAKESWESGGGKGTMQYFPLGMALVVQQRQDVHDAITRLLGGLRKLQDVQVTVEMRLVLLSSKGADCGRAAMDLVGEPVRAVEIRKPASVGRFVSLEDRQVFAFLGEWVQGDRQANMMQMPKVTLFNGQQAGVGSVHKGDGLRYDVLPVVDPDHKNVRVSLDLEFKKGKHVVTAAGTFTLLSDRTLVWQQGEFAGQHLFVLLTPRVIVVKEEERFIPGEITPIPGR